MVGDSLTDVEAGRRAGVRTALVCHVSSLLTEIMAQKSLYPDMLVENLTEAALKIIDEGTTAGGA
jgi:phosphoglycolate phosphatase-like HAD superfamily hydrolase